MNTDDTIMTPPPMAPDHADLLGFGAPDAGFVSHTLAGRFDVAQAEIDERGQRVDVPEGRGTSEAPHIYVSVTPGSTPARKGTTRPRGRPTRQLEPSISAAQMRELRDARDFAAEIGRPLLCAIDIQPGRLDEPVTGDIGEWLRNGPLRIAAQHMNRAKDRAGRPLGWYAVGTRENYLPKADGRDREHMHLMCACPRCERPKLARALSKAFPGDGVFMVHDDEDLDAEGWAYRVKQMHPHAAGPPGPNRPTPEKRNRLDGSPVAPVLGKRIFVSRSIAKPERTRAGWQEERDEARAVAKVKRAADRARRSLPMPVPIGATVAPAGIV